MRISKRKRNKIRNLVVSSALMAMLLSISTFAWFIGMRTVHVSSFDIEIASTESLLLSLDGHKFDTTVNVTGDDLGAGEYTNHTNSWGGEGLKPISTVGEMDSTSSRMILYEKASLTPSPGGYRLLASKINNTGQKEKDGYVVFDLFIKNMSGSHYIKENNPRNEEAIFLADNSYVGVAEGGVEGTGIENSVRVAFAQVGRVNAKEATEEEIRGINCTGDGNVVTGICRDAQIWEPNDLEHVEGALSWYNKSCKIRKETGTNVYSADSFGDPCSPLTIKEEEQDKEYFPTYAVADIIKVEDNVDIYDGAEYNTYTSTNKLRKFPYFTDTDKMKEGDERPEFMTLAPNSVTKVRIYIYIEGQDIDNYDFASIGRKIVVKFGFTKERYEPEDIEYNGPKVDNEPPVITLNGDEEMTINLGESYIEPGATALDNMDGDITEKIVITGEVNEEEAGSYTITYTVEDKAENEAIVTRTVIVVDPDNPDNPEE